MSWGSSDSRAAALKPDSSQTLATVRASESQLVDVFSGFISTQSGVGNREEGNTFYIFMFCVFMLSRDDSATPWTAAGQAPLSVGFSRPECWSGLPFPPPGDLPNPGMEPASPALAGGFFTTEPPGKPHGSPITTPRINPLTFTTTPWRQSLSSASSSR